jgi:hypothetical protein
MITSIWKLYCILANSTRIGIRCLAVQRKEAREARTRARGAPRWLRSPDWRGAGWAVTQPTTSRWRQLSLLPSLQRKAPSGYGPRRWIARQLEVNVILTCVENRRLGPATACREDGENKEIPESVKWCWCELTEYAVDASWIFINSLGVCVN